MTFPLKLLFFGVSIVMALTIHSYEDSIQDLMYQYSDAPWKTCLTEVEVFIGNIMGQSHKQTAYQKESSRAMRDG